MTTTIAMAMTMIAMTPSLPAATESVAIVVVVVAIVVVVVSPRHRHRHAPQPKQRRQRPLDEMAPAVPAGLPTHLVMHTHDARWRPAARYRLYLVVVGFCCCAKSVVRAPPRANFVTFLVRGSCFSNSKFRRLRREVSTGEGERSGVSLIYYKNILLQRNFLRILLPRLCP